MTPWTAARQASLSIANSQSLHKFMSIASVMPSNRLILCCPLLLLPSIFPGIMVFSKESVICIGWSMYGSFRFSFSPSNEYSGQISFRLVGSLCCPRGSQKSSPKPPFKSINFLALSFLYSPTHISIHDHNFNLLNMIISRSIHVSVSLIYNIQRDI